MQDERLDEVRFEIVKCLLEEFPSLRKRVSELLKDLECTTPKIPSPKA